jgi:hypothetical protein
MSGGRLRHRLGGEEQEEPAQDECGACRAAAPLLKRSVVIARPPARVQEGCGDCDAAAPLFKTIVVRIEPPAPAQEDSGDCDAAGPCSRRLW